MMRPAVGALLVLASCSSAPEPPPAEHIAIESDFAPFRTWPSFQLGEQDIPPLHPRASSTVYINRLPPRGAREFPRGTIVVRVADSADPLLSPEVHAMVKRGGQYNSDGATGWEYFDLLLEVEGGEEVPRIRWRGLGPPMGDGYTGPDGGVVLSCNHCHASYLETNDCIIAPELSLNP